MQSIVRVQTFGDIVIEVGGTRVGPESAVFFGLVLYLAAHQGQAVLRSRLREVFWPDAPDASAAHSLRQLLYRLRRLGVEIEATPSHVRLDASAVEADFWSRAASSGSGNGSVGRGHRFLDGYAPTFSQPFAEWVEQERGVVHARVRQRLIAEIAEQRARANWGAVERLATEFLAIDPLNEEATLSLAEATALSGSKAGAIALLDRYVRDVDSGGTRRLELQPSLLRRRIAERLPDPVHGRPLEGAFVGRAESMEFLYRAMQRTRGGQSESCYVWGPAGIGKTRLIEEFTKVAVLQGVRVVRVACQPADQQRPMAVFAELAPQLLALPGAIGVSPESLELLARLSSHDGNAASLSPATAEAAVLAASIRRALFDLIDAVASEACLVVVIEDLHWADPVSGRLLGEMARWAGVRRLGFVCTSRVDAADGWAGLRTHALTPLGSLHARELIASLIGDSAKTMQGAGARWIAIAEGNPFYVRELVTHWQKTGDHATMPPSLASLLRARVGGSTPSAISVLQAIALLGRHATVARLEGMLELPNHVLLEGLDELALAGLVIESEDALSCAHELIAATATDRLSAVGRRFLHRLAAATLESEKASSSSAALLWDCARHWEAAGESTHALDFTIDCSKHLLELGLPTEAVQLLQSARSLCTTLEARHRTDSLLAISLYLAGKWAQVVSLLSEKASQRTFPGPKPLHHDDEELMLLNAMWRADHPDTTTMIGQLTACALATEASTFHRIRAADLGLIVASGLCSASAAQELYAAVSDLPVSANEELISRCRVDMIFNITFGDVQIGAEAATRLATLVQSMGGPVERSQSLLFAGTAMRHAGNAAKAEHFLLTSLDVAQRHNLRSVAFDAADKIAALKLSTNDFEGARKWYNRAVSMISEDCGPLMLLELATIGIQTYLALGDRDMARSIYQDLPAQRFYEGNVRAADQMHAMSVRMQLEQDPSQLSREAVDRLLEAHLRGRNTNGQDFLTDTLLRSLDVSGDEVRGSHIYHDYITRFRHERLPLTRDLAERAAKYR